MEKSIHIILSEIENGFEGEEITTLDKETLGRLYQLVVESEKLNKFAEKFDIKKQKALRESNKLMRRIIDSHGIKYDKDTQAVGISDDDVIYIGEKERVINSPSADPLDTDELKGKITKYERRKYNELIDQFNYLNNQAMDHNKKVVANENNLIDFERKTLQGKEYSRENDYLVIFSKNGKVVLCRR
ncbi:gp63 [Bacillus phage G]|uniref:Gp63 n=1 Tax=Bacillus phage G TaxID=2884420 RepID=G3MBD3_9CAUD|nr:gp63 [Bacillus phage G]AEO93334.1 gp63 [Bacillus phage G]